MSDLVTPPKCRSCGRHIWPKLNDLDLCDACFLREVNQRILHAMSGDPDADLSQFTEWFLRHFQEDLEDYG